MNPPEYPFIVACCVTGKSPWHIEHVLPSAIQAFADQTYPPERRGLVLACERATDVPVIGSLAAEALHQRGIAFSITRAEPPLGNLRNATLDEAGQVTDGQRHLVIQWDDDDWHHPDRIAEQVKHWRTAPEKPCFLQRQLCYSWTHDTAYVREFPNTCIHGTILHVNEPHIRYPVQAKEEDSHFLAHWPAHTVLDNDPCLYVRFDHGHNAWDHAHIMREVAEVRGKWDVTPEQAEFLREVLREYSLPPSENPAPEGCLIGTA